MARAIPLFMPGETHLGGGRLLQRQMRPHICGVVPRYPPLRGRVVGCRSASMMLGASKYGAGTEGSALVDEHGEPLLHIVFVSPQIHWNTGNIGRTCLGLGARLHLVGPLGFSLDERQVRRAGLDYWSHVDVRVYADWAEFSRPGGPLRSLGGKRYFFTKFGAVPAAELEWSPDGPIVLLFGSEVDGFDSIRPWLDGCEEGRSEVRVAFPMVDERFRSFNLSTSASMALWDAYKSRTRLGSRPASAGLAANGGIVGLKQA